MVDLARVRELESQRHALARDAKTLILRVVRDERQPTPEEHVQLHELRREHDWIEHEIQTLFDDA